MMSPTELKLEKIVYQSWKVSVIKIIIFDKFEEMVCEGLRSEKNVFWSFLKGLYA